MPHHGSVRIQAPSKAAPPSPGMSATRDKKSLEEKLTCGLCNDKYKEPKVLACLHSFCKPCLAKIVATAKQGQKAGVACPTCKKWTEVQRKDAVSLPDDYFAENLLAVLAIQSSNGGGVACEVCDTGDTAVSRCNDCIVLLCDFCTQSHKRQRTTNQHQLTSMEDVRSSRSMILSKPIMCKEHEGEVMKLYCEVCDSAICRDCAFHNHREHTVEILTDALLKQRPNIMKLLMKTEGLVPRLEGGIRAVGQMRKKVVANAGDQEAKITTLVDQLIEALEKRRDELVQDVQRMKHSKLKGLEVQEGELQVAVANVRSGAEFTRQAVESENATAIMCLKHCMTKRLEELCNKSINDKPKEHANYGFNEKGIAEISAQIREMGYVGLSK